MAIFWIGDYGSKEGGVGNRPVSSFEPASLLSSSSVYSTLRFLSDCSQFQMDQLILRVAILIVSDTAYQDPSTDKCVDELHSIFRDAGSHWNVVHSQIVPDDPKAIELFVRQWADGSNFTHCIITSGGTGFATKDNTPEVINPKSTI